MTILTNENNVMLTCTCGCRASFIMTYNIKMDVSNPECHVFCSFINGKYFAGRPLKEKIKQMWSLFRGKDLYLMDLVMEPEDIYVFADYVNAKVEEIQKVEAETAAKGLKLETW